MKRVLSGIRATGRLHLGNYLGAVKGMLELQEGGKYETLYMIADGHTITTPYKAGELRRNKREVLLDYLSAGLDPEKSIIFFQSDVPEHFELAFYFSSMITVARMRHLPTFKEKVKQHPENVTMALLNYPVLMSADILIYKAEAVPVGIDQEPHLEVAREIARKMNSFYGTDFPEPKSFKTKGEYIPSLTGEGKMSKSVEGSFINLADDLETIKSKIAKIPTDSGKGSDVSPKTPGVVALFALVSAFQGDKKMKEYASQRLSAGVSYKEVKEDLAKAIYKKLEPIQKERKKLEKKTEYVDGVIKDGAKKAQKIAQKTVEEVKQKMGLK